MFISMADMPPDVACNGLCAAEPVIFSLIRYPIWSNVRNIGQCFRYDRGKDEPSAVLNVRLQKKEQYADDHGCCSDTL